MWLSNFYYSSSEFFVNFIKKKNPSTSLELKPFNHGYYYLNCQLIYPDIVKIISNNEKNIVIKFYGTHPPAVMSNVNCRIPIYPSWYIIFCLDIMQYMTIDDMEPAWYNEYKCFLHRVAIMRLFSNFKILGSIHQNKLWEDFTTSRWPMSHGTISGVPCLCRLFLWQDMIKTPEAYSN